MHLPRTVGGSGGVIQAAELAAVPTVTVTIMTRTGKPLLETWGGQWQAQMTLPLTLWRFEAVFRIQLERLPLAGRGQGRPAQSRGKPRPYQQALSTLGPPATTHPKGHFEKSVYWRIIYIYALYATITYCVILICYIWCNSYVV